MDFTDRKHFLVKPLQRGQTYTRMLGYVQKDKGQPHFKYVRHNVTDAELTEGKPQFVVYGSITANPHLLNNN